MEEAERLCDRIAIVDHGRCIAVDSPSGLIAQHVEPIVFEIIPGESAAAPVIEARLGERIQRVGDTTYLYTADPGRAAAFADQGSLRVLRRAANLEDVFLKFTGRDLRD